MRFYFAYGSNMSLAQMCEGCPSAQLIGPALLRGYRLAFTRRSKVTFPGSGVADIVADPELVVWGAVFELSEDDVRALDRREGAGRAYERLEVDVQHWRDGTQHTYRCNTYAVIDKATPEIRPSPEYIRRLVSGAQECDIRVGYVRFLESLAVHGDGEYRSGLRVYPTKTREQARGRPLIKLPASYASEKGLGRQVAVVNRGRVAQADRYVDHDVDGGTCRLDQTLRHALGMPGRECYGAQIDVFSLSSRLRTIGFASPRVAVLPALAPSRLDVEKSIAVLHQSNIRQLGLTEGAVLRLAAVIKTGDRYSVQTCTRRVFGGSEVRVHRRGGGDDYPKATEIYLDRDARAELGITEYDPVTIYADVGSLFASRLVVYGVTLFLAALALNVYFPEGLTIGLAMLVTFVLIAIDIRSHIHY